MPEALPYARPLFVEEQCLMRQRSGGRIAVVLLIAIFSLVLQFILPRMWNGPRPFSSVAAPFMILGAVGALFPISVIFFKTITVVETGELRLSIRLGPVRIWRRVIPLATIRACELLEPGQPMPSRPSRRSPKFKGVALLRSVRGDTLFMVRGGQPAVVLSTSKSGGTLIGSARAAELAEVIQSALSPTSPLPPFPQT